MSIDHPMPGTNRMRAVTEPRCGSHWMQAAALSCFALAAVPLLAWYWHRITDQSDEPLGVLALVTALVMLVMQLRTSPQSEQAKVTMHPLRLLPGSLILMMLQSSPLSHFPLISGLTAVAVLGVSISLPRGRAGIVTLLILSLPLVASLDFYAGYPMRLAAAHITTLLLQISGLDVERSGVLLLDDGSVVGMDPACAGVRMLWTSCFTAAVMAARLRLSWQRTLLLLGTAVLCVVAGNAVRAAIVFFPESGRVHWPEWMHGGTGLVVHAVVLTAVFASAGRLEGGRRAAKLIRHSRRSISGSSAAFSCMLLGASGIAAVLAAGFITHRPALRFTDSAWPATLDGMPLISVPLSTREARFAQTFPGAVAKFRCGSAEVILRRVAMATRFMHPASDCLRAAGFTITSKPVHHDADGRVWGCALAERGGETWRVRERYVNSDGSQVCTDASAWFWQAALHPGERPWTAITIMEQHDQRTEERLPVSHANTTAPKATTSMVMENASPKRA